MQNFVKGSTWGSGEGKMSREAVRVWVRELADTVWGEGAALLSRASQNYPLNNNILR